MKNNSAKILFVIFIAIGAFGFFNQAKAVDSLVVEFEDNPLFSEANFLPAGEITRWIKVVNNSGITQRIAIQPLNITDSNNFGNVLNLVIKQGATTLYNNSLSNFFANGEVYLSDLANSSNTQYDLTVNFYSDSQNTFQGKSLGFDILIGFQGTEGGILPGAGSTSGYGSGGGGVGWLPPGLTIQNEVTATTTATSATFTWTTSYPASSQVIYALGSESHILDLTDAAGAPPKYGYVRTSLEYDISPKVISHSVTIDGLTPGTTYYYRTVSHASLAISQEHSFITLTSAQSQAQSPAQSQVLGGEISRGEIGSAAFTTSPETSETGVALNEIQGVSEKSSETQPVSYETNNIDNFPQETSLFANLGVIWEEVRESPVFAIALILLIAILSILIINRAKKSKNQQF